MKEWAEWFYQSKAWHKCRKSFLSAHPLCEHCLEHGYAEPAKIVHHKTYLTSDNIHDPDVTMNWYNLEALCQTCHNIEHHGEKNELTYAFDGNGQIVPLPPEKSD